MRHPDAPIPMDERTGPEEAMRRCLAQREQFRQAWKARLEEGAKLRAALTAIVELPKRDERRPAANLHDACEIAREALHDVDFPENEWTDA